MNAYIDDYLSDRYPEIDKTNFYYTLFGKDTFNDNNKNKPVYTKLTKDKGCASFNYFTLDLLEDFKSNYHYICSPITYSSKHRSAKTARKLYAITFDLDFKDNATKEELDESLGTLILRFTYTPRLAENAEPGEKLILKPTAIVTSGTGVHLYYILDKPINMFPNIQKSILKFKNEYIDLFWNKDITSVKQQRLSVTQDFRMVGSFSKNGNKIVRAYLISDKVSVEQLNRYVHFENRIVTEYESKVSLAEAKKLWPDWYERVIVKKEKPTGWARPHFTNSPGLYYWWLNQIKAKATVGHRYHCLRCLVIYAVKCRHIDENGDDIGITYEQVKNDCYMLMQKFDAMSVSDKNRFTENDVKAALLSYQPEYYTYPINSIIYLTGIQIVKNKRNTGKKKLTRKQNLAKILLNHNFYKDTGDVYWNEGGRPKGSQNKEYPKKDQIIQFRKNNPTANKNQCIKATGISKMTVYKWWDAVNELTVE